MCVAESVVPECRLQILKTCKGIHSLFCKNLSYKNSEAEINPNFKPPLIACGTPNSKKNTLHTSKKVERPELLIELLSAFQVIQSH